MTGTVTQRGVFVTVGAARLPLPATAQPVAQWVAELDLCPVCGEPVCECIPPAEWAATLERISVDPHGDLSAWQDCEIPF